VNGSLVVFWIGRLHRRQRCNSSGHHGLSGRGLGIFPFSFGPLCRCGEEGRGCGWGCTMFTHLFLYICYSQESKGILQNSCHPGESLPIPNQLFVASWFSREVSCLAPSFFLFLSRFGNTENRGCERGRTHLRGERGCLPERCPRAAGWNHAAALCCD